MKRRRGQSVISATQRRPSRNACQRPTTGKGSSSGELCPERQVPRGSLAALGLGAENQLQQVFTVRLRVGANRQQKRDFPSQPRSSHHKIKKKTQKTASLMNARCQPQRRAKTKRRSKVRAEQCFHVPGRRRHSSYIWSVMQMVTRSFDSTLKTTHQAGLGARLKLQFLIHSISASQLPPPHPHLLPSRPTPSPAARRRCHACCRPPSAAARVGRAERGAAEEPGCCLGNRELLAAPAHAL